MTSRSSIRARSCPGVSARQSSNPAQSISKKNAIAQQFPGAYVSGELVIDAPDLLKLPPGSPDRWESLVVTGGTVKLRHHPLGQLVVELWEQYVTGSLTIRVN